MGIKSHIPLSLDNLSFLSTLEINPRDDQKCDFLAGEIGCQLMRARDRL